jgi:hypothetical protein
VSDETQRWFGAIPSAWQMAPIGFHFEVALGKMINAGKETGDGTNAPYLAAGSIQPEHLILDDSKQMPFTASELRAYALKRNDIVVVEGGAGYGRSHLLKRDLEGWGFQNHVARVRPRTGRVAPGFLLYCLKACLASGYIEANNRTATLPSLSREVLGAIKVPAPQLDEQRAIADFLDHETAQIDMLVAKQEEFIELLRERRAGIIAGAVAGLRSGDDLEPDDVSWIGACPPGWIRGRVKHFGSVTLGKMLQSENNGDDVLAPYMRAANVQPDGVLALNDVKSMWFDPRELRSLDLQPGDVVVVEGGVGGYGRAAYVAESLEGWGFQNSINRIRPFAGNDGRYLAYFLIMARQKGFITAYCNIVSMPHLTAEKLAAMPMLIPPAEKQLLIANRLDEQTASINALIAKAQEHIAFAKERRAALIMAAVTGQLDVRTARKAG